MKMILYCLLIAVIGFNFLLRHVENLLIRRKRDDSFRKWCLDGIVMWLYFYGYENRVVFADIEKLDNCRKNLNFSIYLTGCERIPNWVISKIRIHLNARFKANTFIDVYYSELKNGLTEPQDMIHEMPNVL